MSPIPAKPLYNAQIGGSFYLLDYFTTCSAMNNWISDGLVDVFWIIFATIDHLGAISSMPLGMLHITTKNKSILIHGQYIYTNPHSRCFCRTKQDVNYS